MNKIPPAQLAGMAMSVLERTAMVLAEPASEAPDDASPTRFARIDFGGPALGSLTLGASEGFLREVAAGLLGVEPDEVDVATQGVDALKELTNMIGGSVIVALSDGKGEFSLGLPALVEAHADQAKASCVLASELGSLRLALHGPAFAKAA